MERIVLRLLRASRSVAAVLSVASAWGCMPDPPAPLPPNGCVVACGTVSAGGGAGMGGAGGAVAGTGGSGGGMGGAIAGTGGGGQGGAPVSEPVPDFSLLDVNPASPTANQPVSPRDYLMRVSAWYFGHAT